MQQRICGREQEFGFRIRPALHFGQNQAGRDDWQKEIMATILLEISKITPSVFSDRISPQPRHHPGYNPMTGEMYYGEGRHSPSRLADLPDLETAERAERMERIARVEQAEQPDPETIRQPANWIAKILWLSNGAAAYVDGVTFLEVATAECLAGSLDVVKQERAAEWILNRAIQSAVRQRGLEDVAFFKNNTLSFSGKPITYGSHHNYSYLMEREENVNEWLRNFIPAALPLTGNGHVARRGGSGFRYWLSQRTFFIKRTKAKESETDFGQRCIIDSRFEPLSGAKDSPSRLHVISRDATRCEFQTWLVDAVTHLIIRLGEEGWKFPVKWRLYHPVREMHLLNGRPDLRYRIRTVSGRKNIISYNRMFLEEAKKLRPLSELERKTLREWERVLDLLQARQFQKLVGKLDWVTKQYLLEISLAKRGLGLGNVLARRINEDYHNISESPKKSWFAWLDRKGLIRHLVSRKAVLRAVLKSPETRAKARGKLVRRCLKNSRLLAGLREVDWVGATFCFKKNGLEVSFGQIRNMLSTSLRGWKAVLKKSKTS